jgi:hypothetical protein
VGVLSIAAAGNCLAADGFQLTEAPDRLVITHLGRHVAEFVYRDATILRPYFANVCAPNGVQVTRKHPPVEGQDATDHSTMHPGIWLAFGDVNSTDFWRNRGRLEHVRFTARPVAGDGRCNFATECRLLTPDGQNLGWLTNRVSIFAVADAWLIDWEATFGSETTELAFGDQEEMGFGARVAMALSELGGGTVTNNGGLTTASRTWGQLADWSDYSGTIDGAPVGLMLMADSANFRSSWWHNRDYGLLVANPFGRSAFHQGAPIKVTVARGQTLRLRFGAAAHSGTGFDPATMYRTFLAVRE